MRIRKFLVGLALAAGLAGCGGGQALEDYAGEAPPLDLRDYLEGPLEANGIFFGRSGEAELRFTVDMVGERDGNVLTLAEDFQYSDGTTDRRVWTLRFEDDARFTGTAGDVEGEAVGRQAGNAATMTYDLVLPRDDGEIVVSMEDWFYLQADGTLINRATMRKYGFEVGELIVVFRKAPEEAG